MTGSDDRALGSITQQYFPLQEGHAGGARGGTPIHCGRHKVGSSGDMGEFHWRGCRVQREAALRVFDAAIVAGNRAAGDVLSPSRPRLFAHCSMLHERGCFLPARPWGTGSRRYVRARSLSKIDQSPVILSGPCV